MLSRKRGNLLECTRKRRTRYQRFVDAYKVFFGCIDCGRIDGRLDLDHVLPRRFILSRAYMHSFIDTCLELEKCVVRCVGCHTIRHNKLRKRDKLGMYAS
jgi:hypothetical protein